MKYKQLCPKSARSNQSPYKQRHRCSLCDSLLKPSSSYRYLFMGKSIHEPMVINNSKTITYAECCKQYFNELNHVDQLTMICIKCSHHLQRIYSLHNDADELTKQMRQTLSKTKRLNRIRSSNSDDITIIAVKNEPAMIPKPIEPVHYRSNIASANSAFVPIRTSNGNFYPMNNAPVVPYAQFMIESPSYQQTNSNKEEITLEEDRSLSPSINDDDHGSKTTRLTRRQYEFLITLPDQPSLNTFIETSASQSNSRWTWRRTSANSRGYKIYYVCNYSMRRHYHPCPAAMYALFNPEGSISIYSHGQHQHIPKNHLPSTITDQTKEEIFKCLQSDMSTSDIRVHLTRLQLPFGDTKKLNNFIKYHKEILRFGAVTNIRLNGTAYRQPQYWAIRRSSPTNPTT
jgi:hypothetical protein